MKKFNNWTLYQKDEYILLKSLDIQCYSDKRYVYVLECSDKLKIGTTKEPYRRLRELKNIGENYSNYTTGSMLVSKVHYNCFDNEKLLHELFAKDRYGTGEMFFLTMEQAMARILKTKLVFEETDNRKHYSVEDISKIFAGDRHHLPKSREEKNKIQFVLHWSDKFKYEISWLAYIFHMSNDEIINKVEKYINGFCVFESYKEVFEKETGIVNGTLIEICEYFPDIGRLADECLDWLRKISDDYLDQL